MALLADVGAPRVVARPGAGVHRGAGPGHTAGAGHTGLVANPRPRPALPLQQPCVDLGEGRPPLRDLVPALHHEGVHAAGAVLGARQQLPRPDHLYHLAVAVAVVRLEPEAVNLPENNTKGPDVRLSGELAIQDTLGWHPPNWQKRFALHPVVVRAVDVTREAKV